MGAGAGPGNTGVFVVPVAGVSAGPAVIDVVGRVPAEAVAALLRPGAGPAAGAAVSNVAPGVDAGASAARLPCPAGRARTASAVARHATFAGRTRWFAGNVRGAGACEADLGAGAGVAASTAVAQVVLHADAAVVATRFAIAAGGSRSTETGHRLRVTDLPGSTRGITGGHNAGAAFANLVRFARPAARSAVFAIAREIRTPLQTARLAGLALGSTVATALAAHALGASRAAHPTTRAAVLRIRRQGNALSVAAALARHARRRRTAALLVGHAGSVPTDLSVRAGHRASSIRHGRARIRGSTPRICAAVTSRSAADGHRKNHPKPNPHCAMIRDPWCRRQSAQRVKGMHTVDALLATG